jgi:hypothetical protein
MTLAACGQASTPLPAVDAPSPTVRATATPLVSEPPTLTPSSRPSPTAQPPTDRPSLPVTITSLTSPIDAGKMARVAVKTSPGASCDIDVTYESRVSEAAGLEDKKAPADGTITWTWLVGANTNPGTRSVDIYCELGDAAGSASRDLVVR